MDSLLSAFKPSDKKEEEHHNKDEHHNKVPSSSELLSSAKVVAGAAQTTFSQGSDKVDKGRVAGASENLLDGASHYGKLEEKGYGQYVEKAENYLHQYSSHSTTSTTGSGHHPESAAGETHSAPPQHGGGDGHSAGSGGGGYGDYMKMAEGFLKKN